MVKEPERASDAEVIEVFHTDSVIVARKIVDVLLGPEGVDATLHDRKDQAFPGLGQPGGMYVAVPMGQREKALGLIDEARENGFLDEDEGERV
jgi:hypothetical protein